MQHGGLENGKQLRAIEKWIVVYLPDIKNLAIISLCSISVLLALNQIESTELKCMQGARIIIINKSAVRIRRTQRNAMRRIHTHTQTHTHTCIYTVAIITQTFIVLFVNEAEEEKKNTKRKKTPKKKSHKNTKSH